MGSPPASPPPARPMSAMFQAGRSSSRMSFSSKQGGGSRASDEDGKTSVKVAVRVRPPLRPSDPGFELVPQRYQRSMVHTTTSTGLTVESPQGRKFFIFDKVFGEDTYQEGVWEYIKDSVDAFMQGYNVSVLAYGQSGSGKSYTMGTSAGGEQNSGEQMGVIPRAASVLFSKLSGHPSLRRSGSSSSGLRTPTRYSMHGTQGLPQSSRAQAEKNWQMKATYVEVRSILPSPTALPGDKKGTDQMYQIYNEQLRDLLLPDDAPLTERPTVAIREDPRGRILLTGLRQVSIESAEDLIGALNFGSSIRQTDSTAINAKSSRSHAVFSINLVQRKNKAEPAAFNKRFSVPVETMNGAEDWVTMDSKLHFVDLAGSERLKNTGASGDRAKEGISINAGLASLGKVISQLSSRHAGTHISYRDSKLTRLLQDSLGGNAITYMIACVTPAEFYLSETLNTVQYAQRARAIQSKPQIQQVSDDSDKQAVIDRLRMEVSFLRQQIRSSEVGFHAPQERSERQNERELELQNHLLDVQENYTALGQRHAKLISEITKARNEGDTGETPTLTEAIGDSAVERLKRSNSFAEAVEQVVLEYEKTIQSLEISLSNTRSTLASTESTLLEKENKCAYVETINQQLQSRVQKLMDREASNEQYLHNLEAKLDGQASGDEKSSALVAELRKEIARIRENEAQCEDYISTLEERLAEADQDLELKQRELDRLEHVIERQRSLGKLDNLIYEFDHLQQNGNTNFHQTRPEKPLTNGISKPSSKHDHRRLPTLEEAANTAIPESDDEDLTTLPNGLGAHDQEDLNEPRAVEKLKTEPASHPSSQAPVESPAQAKAVADKLENVTQELFDLRIQHESTLSEYDMMTAKYEEALRTLAELQDAVDEARHPNHARDSTASPASSTRPTSFLEDARVTELKDGGHLTSSRSLSSELSLAADSSTSVEPSVSESHHRKNLSGDSQGNLHREEALVREIDDLKRSHIEKDEAMADLKTTYSELQELHVETLDIVEELKSEITKAKMNGPTTQTSPVIRRKSSQNVMTIDRAHRSLASLKNIAADNFENDPDTMQSFELNLNTAMHELHQRSERVQLLEGELGMLKKEMESKSAIISGLARERSSIKATSPIMDMSVMSTMNDQLMQREDQMRQLEEKHAAREQELAGEIESLKQSLERAQAAKSAIPGLFPRTPATPDETDNKQLGHDHATTSEETAELQQEISQWRSKHQAVVESMQASETKLLSTIAELESALTAAERTRTQAEERAKESEGRVAVAARAEDEKRDHDHTIESLRRELDEKRDHDHTVESLRRELDEKRDHDHTVESLRRELDEKRDHDHTVESLRRELDEHKATAAMHVDKIARLAQLQESARNQAEEANRFMEVKETQLESHRQRILSLEEQVQEHHAAVEFHKHGLKSLHDSHAREIDNMRSTIQNHEAARFDMERNLQNMQDAHTGHITRLESEVIDLKAQLERSQRGLAEDLEQSRATCNHLEKQREELRRQAETLKSEMAEAAKAHQLRVKEMDMLRAEKDRAANLVEELEEQLSNSYDQQQASSSRLSQLNSSHSNQQQAVNEANAAVTTLEKQLESTRNQVEQLQSQIRESQQIDRSSSTASNLRKSASATSLPSPPPAIPLPPLPAGAIASPASATFPGSVPPGAQPPDSAALTQLNQTLADREAHIKQMEKHLFAEKQLTATLEEALVDLENQGKKTKQEMEAYKKKCWGLEDEVGQMRKEGKRVRDSVQAVQEEKEKRVEAERAREKLEERMRMLDSSGKKKKKGAGFNCF
ncbi:MAG: hypothetical protein Q9163_003587 [Psora crenata]